MINPKNLKKSILDYAIRGELSAKYRRENQAAVASNTISGSLNDEKHHPNCHCETCQKASRGNLPTTESQANDYNDKEIATTAPQSRNDGILTAFDEIAAYNAKITQIKGQRETLLLQIEKQHKSEKNAHRKARLKTLSGSLKNKIKTYRTITPLNQNPEFTPPFDIPKEWAWVKLGEICEIVRGGSPRPIENYLTNSENGLNWIKIGDTDIGGKYIRKTAQKITKDGLHKTRFVKAGSLLLTNSMSFGRPYILEIDGCIHDGWLVLSKFQNLATIDFLFNLLTCGYVQKSFRETVAGAVVKNLSTEKVQETIIPLPPLAEQQFIAGQLEQALTACEQYESTVNALLNLEDGLFNKISKSVLDYAIHGELSAQYRRENAPAVIASRDLSRRGNLLTTENAPNDYNDKGIATTATQSRNDAFPAQEMFSGSLKTDTVILSEAKNLKKDNTNLSGSLNDENHHPNCHCETCQKASRGNLPTTESQANDYNDKEIATTATQSRNDGVLTAFDEIAAYNAKTAKIKAQREKLLDRIEKQLKAEKGTKRKKDTVIASRQTFVGGETAYECVAQSEAKGLMRGNLLTMENAPNLHSDKGIATTATQSRNDGFPAQEVLSGSTKTPEQRTEQLKRISGSLKNKIKTYRTITPLNQNPEFTPPFDIPKEWAWVKLGDLGQVVSGGTPPTSDESNFGGDIAWITPADLTYYDKKYISHGNRKLTEKGYKASSSQLMPKGSVLFSSRAPIGYVVIASNPVCTNQGFKNIVPFSIVSSEFLYYFLKSAKETAISLASGTTFKEISAKNFAEIKIPLPPLAEQRFIAGKLEKLLDLCKKLKTKP